MFITVHFDTLLKHIACEYVNIIYFVACPNNTSLLRPASYHASPISRVIRVRGLTCLTAYPYSACCNCNNGTYSMVFMNSLSCAWHKARIYVSYLCRIDRNTKEKCSMWTLSNEVRIMCSYWSERKWDVCWVYVSYLPHMLGWSTAMQREIDQTARQDLGSFFYFLTNSLFVKYVII